MEQGLPLWAVIFVAFGGLTGLAGLVTAISSARTSARKSELDSLRDTVETLQQENERLRSRITELEDENAELRKALGMRPKGKKAIAPYPRGLARNDHS